MARISNKLVHGKGVKGNGITKINGKRTKAYVAWSDMLRRCCDPKYLSRNPTYISCTVCEKWLFFPTFQKWFDENYVEGFHLDKDLLVAGNKIYSPETCVFVPQCINVLFNDSGRIRGEHPMGVTFHKQIGKFRAKLKADSTQKHLGYFGTADEAHRAYLIAKKKNVIRVVTGWKSKIPIRLYEALIRKANDLI